MRVDDMIHKTVRRMQADANERDQAMDKVRSVRAGRFQDVWPDQFSERYPNAIVANFVDQSARDIAANLSPLPSLACSAGSMRTNIDKRRAERKNRIGANFWRQSKLERAMKSGADQYLTYGFLSFWVEADYVAKLPKIRVEDPVGCYYELNRDGDTVRWARVYRESIQKLAIQFPDSAPAILNDPKTGKPLPSEGDTQVVRYIDDTHVIMYLPERENVIVGMYAHGQWSKGADGQRVPYCPVRVAQRPGFSETMVRGQFDDVIFVQMAHAMMAALTLEAGHKAVQAPIAAPSDVQELNVGPDALIVSDNADKIRRLELNVPAAAFQLGESLRQEMKEGAGYPDTRMGVGPAGGSTGRGISALEGGFDSQIKLGQDVLGEALRHVTMMCFRMEVLLWPMKRKTITGNLSGESFEVTYTPQKDIGEDTEVDLTYGFAAGASANSAIVTLLQLRGDGIIGRDTFRRQLPFDIDIEQQQRELDVQELEDGLKQGMAGALTATGQMIAQGQVQGAVQLFSAITDVIRGRQAGGNITDLVEAAFQKQLDAAQAQAAQQPPGPPGMPGAPGGAPGGPPDPSGGGGGDLGMQPNGLPDGVAPGQAGMPPGGRPSIMDLTAGFTAGGAPNVNAGIRRRIATG